MPYGVTPAGFVSPATTDIVTLIQTDELATLDAGLDLSPVQPLGQINGIVAAKLYELWALAQVIYQGLDPDNAVGAQLDAACALVGTKRRSATYGVVSVNVVGTPAASFLAGAITSNVSGQPTNLWTSPAFTLSAGGTATVNFTCTQTGPIACNAGTLVLTAPVVGITSITNPANATQGTAIETDTALRLRRIIELTAAGGSTDDALRTDLINVPGVIQAIVLDNVTNVTDSNGVPPHSFRAVIWDGSSPAATNAAIGAAIWADKPSGIASDGATSQAIVDSAGNTQTVFFTRATAVQIYVSLTVSVNRNTWAGDTPGAAAIQAAIVAFINASALGAKVVAIAVESTALTVAGVVDVTAFTIGTAPAPAASANIILTATQIAQSTVGNIVVTVLP